MTTQFRLCCITLLIGMEVNWGSSILHLQQSCGLLSLCLLLSLFVEGGGVGRAAAAYLARDWTLSVCWSWCLQTLVSFLRSTWNYHVFLYGLWVDINTVRKTKEAWCLVSCWLKDKGRGPCRHKSSETSSLKWGNG